MEAHLTWVLVENELHNVREFSGLKPNQRPTTYCPVCKRQVIMRLGNIRVFHAAHKPEDICAVTQPETALHLNTKLHIASELRKKRPLLIDYPCKGVYSNVTCQHGKTRQVTYIADWDEVRVEYHIEQYKPDIVLLKNGEAVGAVEVFVTHSIEPEKEVYLQELSIPWVEVDATEILSECEKAEFWKADQPIPFRKLNTKAIQSWLCPECEKELEQLKLEKQKKELARQQELEAKKTEEIRRAIANQYETTGIRVVDFYYPDHKRYRTVFLAKKRVENGIISEIEISDDSSKIYCSIKNPKLPDDANRLKTTFENLLQNFRNKGYIVDAHMHWHVWETDNDNGVFLDHKANGMFPKRYCWSGKYNKWIPFKIYQSVDWNEYFTDSQKYSLTLKDKLDALDKQNTNSVTNSFAKQVKQPVKNIQNIAPISVPNKKQIVERQDDFCFPPSPPPPPVSRQREKECIICHCVTEDYWNSKGDDCICRKCADEGKTASFV